MVPSPGSTGPLKMDGSIYKNTRTSGLSMLIQRAKGEVKESRGEKKVKGQGIGTVWLGGGVDKERKRRMDVISILVGCWEMEGSKTTIEMYSRYTNNYESNSNTTKSGVSQTSQREWVIFNLRFYCLINILCIVHEYIALY